MSVAVSCQACGAILQIPDALYQRRFAGRQVKLRCKKCPAVISVDDSKASPPVNAATTSSHPKPLGELSELIQRMPQRNMSPTSLGAVTIGVEQLELLDEEEAPPPASSPSITAAPEAIDLTSHREISMDPDEAIFDAITVCALFNFYNRWIDASGVHALSDEAHKAGGKRSAVSGYARS